MINDLVKNNIQHNVVYHGSPIFIKDKIMGEKTGEWSKETGSVFVTPCIGIAACFVVDKQQILDQLDKQFPNSKIVGLNFGYDIWNKPVEQLYEIPNHINIFLNLPKFKSFSGTSIGFIYTIDYSKYQNQCHMFNKNPNSDVEFLIEGDVEYCKCTQITINWTCQYSNDEIKKHGEAIIEDLQYEPPYTYEQLLDNGYLKELADKLKDDPVHGWRMVTGIELIHKEPTKQEQQRIWKNWLLMSPKQKDISDKKSLELFGLTNSEHHKKIMVDFWKNITEQSKFNTLFKYFIQCEQ